MLVCNCVKCYDLGNGGFMENKIDNGWLSLLATMCVFGPMLWFPLLPIGLALTFIFVILPYIKSCQKCKNLGVNKPEDILKLLK